ncbi:MAG TPA: hypothetical protein VFH80_21570 [Solirubrobacteraceae bacterium]|nr:hypothetical protein [Solirubrobacteraceae bacterium]
MSRAGHGDHARRAFDRAVQSELAAIALHDAAAARLEEMAGRLERAAATHRGALVGQEALATAANARARAQAARLRAQSARERLRQEGVDPDSPVGEPVQRPASAKRHMPAATPTRSTWPPFPIPTHPHLPMDRRAAGAAKHHADDLRADADDRQRSALAHRKATEAHLARGVDTDGPHGTGPVSASARGSL